MASNMIMYSTICPKLKGGTSRLVHVPKKQQSIIKCSCSSSSSSSSSRKLEVGSPIVIIEAPKMLKTAVSVPCLRINNGLVKPGDVGRIMSRKPKDTWAVRLRIGTYLIDAKYFKPLDLDDQ